jgi:rsbT co-antagonist protein RsbR
MAVNEDANRISAIISKCQSALLNDWMSALMQHMIRIDSTTEQTLHRYCSHLLGLIKNALAKSALAKEQPTADSTADSFIAEIDIEGAEWDETRHLLTEISQERARQGSTPSETATFVFSLKQPLFVALRDAHQSQHDRLSADIWTVTTLLDKLGLFTVEIFQRSRNQIIARQQQELLELSTPVVKLWHNILALPLIGTLDSSRTQVVMENLLQKIIDTGALIAIIDITGVPTVDTLVAQHLLKTIAAARLMGADCIISGIRPQIAQTIVHLGVNLEDVVTKATLADAFSVALARTGASIHNHVHPMHRNHRGESNNSNNGNNGGINSEIFEDTRA